MRVPALSLFALSLVPAASVRAQDKKPDPPEPPRIAGINPLQLVKGEKVRLGLRGPGLKEATEVKVTPECGALLKEKKEMPVPKGLEAKSVGTTELVVELTPPANAARLSVQVLSPHGASEARELEVFSKEQTQSEQEPNFSFRDANPLQPGKPMLGAIQVEKDVDVFRMEARAGVKFTAQVRAATLGSWLDPILSLHDAKGRPLLSNDDTNGRDASLSFTPVADGTLFLVVVDANDRGGPGYNYRLEVSP